MKIDQEIQNAIQNHQRGSLREAEAICRRVLAIEPNNADALQLLGVIAFQTGRLDMALNFLQRVIQLRPQRAETHNFLANALRAKGLQEQAIAAYREAVQLKENFTEAHYNLGTALREAGRVGQAIDEFRKVLELQPEFLDAANDLGSALRELWRLEEAVAVLTQAVQRAPRFFKAHNNLGNALKALGRFDEAEAAVRTALRLMPNMPEIHVNLGNVLREKGDLAGAAAATREAIRLRPGMADAHQNLGHILMLSGKYTEAWPEHEWRWRCENMARTRAALEHPQWDGSNLDGRTILIHSDAGLGDAIHCLRYIPMVKDRGGKIVVECQRELHRTVRNLAGVEQVLTEQDPLPRFDVHCDLMSLPTAFNTTLETIPSQVPYLPVDDALVRNWAEKLSNDPRSRVGLIWAGNPLNTVDRKRSVRMEILAPLAAAGDIAFHSLQLGDAARQILTAPEGFKVIDHSHELMDFVETAALAMNLDLIISVDTSVAHLAGALGRPVWTMVPYSPDWRWLLGRDDSPWYPTMRLFRQKKFGDWREVVERITKTLGEFAKR